MLSLRQPIEIVNELWQKANKWNTNDDKIIYDSNINAVNLGVSIENLIKIIGNQISFNLGLGNFLFPSCYNEKQLSDFLNPLIIWHSDRFQSEANTFVICTRQ